ncbi:hypothetical protein VP01_2049g1 [Puccinia sorghi]|uniref:Uncharacterized protein n=1 Tax=Puccinia sorghi TaxID=27349 RepID=A0A0L6VAT3_9BASI|nr:hypothetical protein VP01_2049g1 [Puccinia sorghi]
MTLNKKKPAWSKLLAKHNICMAGGTGSEAKKKKLVKPASSLRKGKFRRHPCLKFILEKTYPSIFYTHNCCGLENSCDGLGWKMFSYHIPLTLVGLYYKHICVLTRTTFSSRLSRSRVGYPLGSDFYCYCPLLASSRSLNHQKSRNPPGLLCRVVVAAVHCLLAHSHAHSIIKRLQSLIGDHSQQMVQWNSGVSGWLKLSSQLFLGRLTPPELPSSTATTITSETYLFTHSMSFQTPSNCVTLWTLQKVDWANRNEMHWGPGGGTPSFLHNKYMDDRQMFCCTHSSDKQPRQHCRRRLMSSPTVTKRAGRCAPEGAFCHGPLAASCMSLESLMCLACVTRDGRSPQSALYRVSITTVHSHPHPPSTSFIVSIYLQPPDRLISHLGSVLPARPAFPESVHSTHYKDPAPPWPEDTLNAPSIHHLPDSSLFSVQLQKTSPITLADHLLTAAFGDKFHLLPVKPAFLQPHW